MGNRLYSEIIRSSATFHSMKGLKSKAKQLSLHAVSIDSRNPRAYLQLAIDCWDLQDKPCTVKALLNAKKDLPTRAVVENLEQIYVPIDDNVRTF